MTLALTPEELDAIRLSLRVALWAMACSLPPAVLVALVLARGRFWGKALLDGIVHLPLVLPPVVTGYLLLLLFGRQGPLGRFFAEAFGLVFAFRWTGAALAAVMARRPALWLLDEPHAALDAGGRRLVAEVVAEALDAGSAVLVASHEPAEVLPLADRVVSMSGGRVQAARRGGRHRSVRGARGGVHVA